MATCKYDCGENNLHWKVIEGKYKLFDTNNIMHICKDGRLADKDLRVNATKKIVKNLGLDDPIQLPSADDDTKKTTVKDSVLFVSKKEPKEYFTITTTSTGIAVTGDDKNNPIYLPKIAVKDLVKALLEFI